MKIGLGIIVRNQRYFLEQTLPAYSFMFEHRVAVDFFSDDFSREILDQFGFNVHRQEWPGTFAGARNVLIQTAEEMGLDFLVMLDADEALAKPDCIVLQNYAQEFDAIVLPRIEFVGDTNHFDDFLFPDFQLRAFRLGKNYHYRNKVHEMLYNDQGKALIAQRGGRSTTENILTLPTVPIYHYGRTNPDRSYMALKYINYDLIQAGKKPLAKLPDGFDLENAKFWERSIPFFGPHPLTKSKPVITTPTSYVSEQRVK